MTARDLTAPEPNGRQAEQGSTHVVTCFLLRRDRGHDELFLVRRSDRVRTYRGHWAGISGYVEAGVSPQDQAYTELREEAGVAPEDVTLLRVGSVLPVHDTQQGLEWVVHPFLFAIADPARIQIDWEAGESRWITPDDLGALLIVPGLREALARVYPPDPGATMDPADGICQ
jgi:8-oxo-dGTP pyrophosphatase MutT (NUDIX family)